MAAILVCVENDIARFHGIFFKKRIHFKLRETNCLRKLQNKKEGIAKQLVSNLS